MSESELVTACLLHLKLHGVLAWRNQSGCVQVKRGKYTSWMRLAPKGSPDIIGILPGGKFLGIECKRPGGKLTDEQTEFLRNIHELGGVAFEVRSISELMVAMGGVLSKQG